MKKLISLLALVLTVCSTAMAEELYLDSEVGTIGTLNGREAMVVDLGGTIGKVAVAIMNVGAEKQLAKYAGIATGTKFELSKANDPNENLLTDGWYVPSKAELEALQKNLSPNKTNFHCVEWDVTDAATLYLPSWKKESGIYQGRYISSDREKEGDTWMCWTYEFLFYEEGREFSSNGWVKYDEQETEECLIRPFHKLYLKENCRIYYTSSDDNVVEPNNNNFNVSVESNTYENGKGVIVFSGELTSIGDFTFYNKSNLTSVTIPASVKEFGWLAFCGCSQLADLIFAEGSQLETIGNDAFMDTSISGNLDYLPASLKSIGDYAFSETQITAVIIPNSVKGIGERAFDECKSLETLTFAEGSQLETIGGAAFSGTGITGELTIPATVKNIGGSVFMGCQLTKVYMSLEDLTSISNQSFDGCGAVIIVPATLYGAYKSHFSGWNKVEVNSLSDWKEYAIAQIEVAKKAANTLSDTDRNTISTHICTIENATTFDGTLDAYYAALALIDQQKEIEKKVRGALAELAMGHSGPAIRVTGKNGKSIMLFELDKVEFVNIDAVGQGEAEATGIGNVRWVQLWAGGPKFAEYNVGATSTTGYGGYYLWGGFENVVGIDHPSHNEGTSALTGDTDTVTKLWGDNWRMPTKDELEALLDPNNCDSEWTTINGINGRIFTGKGDYGCNSIFLPATGSCNYGGVSAQGNYGYYWSSLPDTIFYAYLLYVSSTSSYVFSNYRSSGFSVRAVLNETE